VLACYNWPPGSERYRKVQRFIQYLFTKFDKLQHPPFHAKWHDVNLAATVPGWTRYSVAQDMLQQAQQKFDLNTSVSSQPRKPASDAAVNLLRQQRDSTDLSPPK
jgi:hypothetical protein